MVSVIVHDSIGGGKMRETYALFRIRYGWIFSYYNPSSYQGRSFEVMADEAENELTVIVDGSCLDDSKYEGDSLEVLFDKIEKVSPKGSSLLEEA